MSLSHSFGLVAGLLAASTTGATLIAFGETPSPASLFRAAENADVLHLTPPLARLAIRRARRQRRAKASKAGESSVPSPRVISVGAGPMTNAELRSLVMAFPQSRIAFTYGLTELGPRVATLIAGERGEARAAIADEGRAAIGAPLEGVTLTVTDQRLFVRSPYASLGRLVDAELSPLATPFDTRDSVAEASREGAIVLSGRTDGAIVRGGTNVYPEDIEAAARAQAGVRDAICVGVSSPTYGQVPHLVIELDDEVDMASGNAHQALVESLLESLPTRLRPVEVPVEIHVRDELPRSSLGKVLRAEIARELDPEANV